MANFGIACRKFTEYLYTCLDLIFHSCPSYLSTFLIFCLFVFLVAISSAFVCLAGLFLLCVPGYGRHSEVYGDRIAISNRQPPLPVSTPPMDVRKSLPPPNYYPSVQRPLSVQGYATRSYSAGQYSNSSGYPGHVRAGGYHSMSHGYGGF